MAKLIFDQNLDTDKVIFRVFLKTNYSFNEVKEKLLNCMIQEKNWDVSVNKIEAVGQFNGDKQPKREKQLKKLLNSSIQKYWNVPVNTIEEVGQFNEIKQLDPEIHKKANQEKFTSASFCVKGILNGKKFVIYDLAGDNLLHVSGDMDLDCGLLYLCICQLMLEPKN